MDGWMDGRTDGWTMVAGWLIGPLEGYVIEKIFPGEMGVWVGGWVVAELGRGLDSRTDGWNNAGKYG